MKPEEVAIKTAKKSLYPRFRHGATIAKGSKIVASGCNTPKPRAPDISFSTHAEIVALKRLITLLVRTGRADRFDLYVARVNPLDRPAMSHPCPKCMAAIRKSGVISKIYYTGENGQWESAVL